MKNYFIEALLLIKYNYKISKMSTPEEKLARTMRSEYRKTSFPIKRVCFKEPVYILTSPTGVSAGYIVTAPGVSSTDSTSFVRSSCHIKKESTPSREETHVPDYLKARGIIAAIKPKCDSSKYDVKCNVPACSIRHPSHYCNVCDKWNVSHIQEDCPLYKNKRYYF